jgi:hypothetical protein
MNYSKHKRPGSFVAIHDAEGKLLKRVFAKTYKVDGPTLGKLFDLLDGLPESAFKPNACGETSLAVPG